MPKLHRLRDVDPVAIALCKRGANGQRIFLRKAEGKLVTIAEEMPLHKASVPDWSTLYCVVAQPEARENGGMLDPDKVDVWDSEDEIRKAAHRLMKNRGVVNVEHGTSAEAHIVESAVALTPIALADVTVPAGAWYVGIEPSAELRKAYDDGELTGVSLEGTGVREVAGDLDEAEVRTVFKRLADALGLRGQTGTLGSSSSDEETDVDTTQLENKVEEIAKAQGATTTAVEGLLNTVNKLIDRLDRGEERKDEKETSAEDIKKAVDELAGRVGDKLDEFDAALDKLADTGSSQQDEDIKKARNADPLAGILN